jgi:hypothetical protein
MNNKIEVGNKFWCNDKGQFHREDGPAIVWEDGSKEWWFNDELHRLDGKKEWYIHDDQIDCKNNEEFLSSFPHRMMGLTD